jgi:putative tryptophan/tyrosine transport system substrate-binding protein
MTQARRRQFLTAAVVLFATPLAAGAQPAPELARVGILANLPPPPAPVTVAFLSAFREGLKESGFIEGSNLVIQTRWEPVVGKLPGRAAELIDAKVGVIVTFTTPATRAALDASRSIPIVFTMVSDPVGSGFVASLGRPGGNVTGVANVFPDLSGKLLGLVREVVPFVGRVAVLWNPDNPGKRLDLEELVRAAGQTRVTLQPFEVRTAADFGPAFSAIQRTRPDALITLVEIVTWLQRQEIIDFALKHRLATAFNLGGHVELGGLISYAPRTWFIHQRAGVLAGKILKGAQPADLPVEQPTLFELSVNLKTAKALGLTIPPSMLLRADLVVE